MNKLLDLLFGTILKSFFDFFKQRKDQVERDELNIEKGQDQAIKKGLEDGAERAKIAKDIQAAPVDNVDDAGVAFLRR
jgi:hypothetical protein